MTNPIKLFKKLNQDGFTHVAALAVIVVAVAVVGTYFLVRSHADTTTYSCPQGGTLSGTTCSYPATYTSGSTSTYASLCNSGDSSSTYNWNNTGGYHCAHLVSSVGLYGSCPSGQYKAYTYCYTIYRPYCNSGDTISSDYSTCTHVVAAGYSCPSGGTPSGSTCYYAATATTTSSPPPVTYPYADSSSASTDLSRINNYRSSKGYTTLAETSCLDTIATNWAKKEATQGAIQDPPGSWLNTQFNSYCGRSWYSTPGGANDGEGPDDSSIFTALLNSCPHIQNIADHGSGNTTVRTPNGQYCTFNSSRFDRIGTGAWLGTVNGQGPFLYVSEIFAHW